NNLLIDLRTLAVTSDAASLGTFPVLLDEDRLKHINVTRGAGNIALLKNEGRLTWPLALSRTAFQLERERLSARATEAVKQARLKGQVDAGTIRQMTADVDHLDRQLRTEGKDLSPRVYIEAKTFLKNFGDAITALRQDDVANHFNGKYALRANSVAELIKHLTDEGLQFAPAV